MPPSTKTADNAVTQPDPKAKRVVPSLRFPQLSYTLEAKRHFERNKTIRKKRTLLHNIGDEET